MFHNYNEKIHNNSLENKESLDKESNFWSWYLWILQEARILDTSYSVKGSYVWLDWGYQIYNLIYAHLKQTYLETGHKQMQFPTLIKEETFLKETEFIRNFENDVFWVDREGQKSLQQGERLALRPTSELIIYPMFAKWIQSWRDLPLKVFQNVSIFRCETNETRPLIRNRETIGFIEGHSAFSSALEAKQFLDIVLKSYLSIFEKIGIPVKLIEVPSWDRFAGATLTIDGYVILPGSKSMELFTAAYLGTTFSDIFDIQYLNAEKNKLKAHLLCYGPSIDRILATVIALFGDNRGLRLIPEIAPTTAIIIPIYNQKNKGKVSEYISRVSAKLRKLGLSFEIDTNDTTTPGSKFYRAERLGIPLRIEIGNKEVTQETLTITQRDNLKKHSFNLTDSKLKQKINSLLHEISNSMKSNVLEIFQNAIEDLTAMQSLNELTTTITLEKDKMYQLGWCGNSNCATKIETETQFTLLGYDYKNKNRTSKCLICNMQGKIAILAKRY